MEKIIKTIKYFSILSVLTTFTNYSFSQISGKCMDISGNPLPYINISVNKSSIGTVSDENGFFNFGENQLQKDDTLVFTHIGFVSQRIPYKNNSKVNVTLISLKYQLKELEISASGLIFKKEKIVGTKANSDNVVLNFKSKHLGTEVGKLINIKKGKAYKVQKVYLNISQLDYASSSFRINFYNATMNKEIESVRENYIDIIKEVSKNGLVEIDVSDRNLIFENDFLVSIEWISFTENKLLPSKIEPNIYFNSTVFSGPLYFRSNNLIKWKKDKSRYNVGLGIHLSVKY